MRFSVRAFLKITKGTVLKTKARGRTRMKTKIGDGLMAIGQQNQVARGGETFKRRVFWPWAALARPSQPAAGMLRPRRLAHGQNPSPQPPSEFSDKLLVLYQTEDSIEKYQQKLVPVVGLEPTRLFTVPGF